MRNAFCGKMAGRANFAGEVRLAVPVASIVSVTKDNEP